MLRTRNLLLFRVVSTGKQIVREIERKYSPIHWNSNFNCSTVQEQNQTVFQLPRLTLQSPGLTLVTWGRLHQLGVTNPGRNY